MDGQCVFVCESSGGETLVCSSSVYEIIASRYSFMSIRAKKVVIYLNIVSSIIRATKLNNYNTA